MDSKAYLDFNRSGTPLVEVVTAPDFHTSDEVTDFLKELQRVVKRNDIAYADLEKGQMRVDVNLSVSDTDELGTRVEIKNMNSFSAIRRAIEYEYNRHIDLIKSG
jgi:aspartyl-tRNA(Asn)/glutamyl-tRNA(Gln) amidotransferase subunit B